MSLSGDPVTCRFLPPQEALLIPTHRHTVCWARWICLVGAALLLSHGAHAILDGAEQDRVEVPILS